MKLIHKGKRLLISFLKSNDDLIKYKLKMF
jgi:hypothetical protein